MAIRVFLDANILLDFTLKRADYDSAKRIVSLAVNNRINAVVTPSVVQICSYWIAKAYGEDEARVILRTLLSDIICIDTTQEVVLTALHSLIKDTEDAIQYYTALYHKVDFFISRDKKFQSLAMNTLPIYSPEDFLVDIIGAE